MTQTYYMCIGRKAWDKMRVDKYLSPSDLVDEDYDEFERRMDVWMMEKMRKMLPSSAFHPIEEANGSHFMFLKRTDLYSPFTDNSVVLEINTNPDHVLYFDDNSYVQVVNSLCNGWKDTYLAFTEKEADEKKNASEADVEESWLRMFDLTTPRDLEYTGDIELRGMTPLITLEMVKAYEYV